MPLSDLADMDHISLLALHDQLMEQTRADAANELTLHALGAQGDPKSIQKTIATMTGQNPNQFAADGDINDLQNLAKR